MITNKDEKITVMQAMHTLVHLHDMILFKNIKGTEERRSRSNRECYKCGQRILKGSNYYNHQIRYNEKILVLSFHVDCYKEYFEGQETIWEEIIRFIDSISDEIRAKRPNIISIDFWLFKLKRRVKMLESAKNTKELHGYKQYNSKRDKDYYWMCKLCETKNALQNKTCVTCGFTNPVKTF